MIWKQNMTKYNEETALKRLRP